MERTTEKNVSTSDQAPGRTALPRSLGLLSAIAVLIGSTIGTGIFRSPAGIATKVPDEGLYLLLWALGGFFSLCGALTLAELAGALPHTGGVFVYLREGWGKLPAFLFGWSELTIIRASALGAVATVFAEYFLRLLGKQSPAAVHYVAAGAILLVAVFNILGVKLGALVQNLTTAAKYGALLLLVLAAFAIGGNNPAPVPAQQPDAQNQTTIVLFGLAFISLLWVYDGWADVTFLSGEVKRPERNLPLTIIGGTLAVIAIYLLANFAYLHLLDINQIAGSKLVAADTAYRIVGETGVKLVSIAVMISAFGTLNGSMMTGPRIFFAMADDGLFFKKIASVHPRFKTPHVAISLAAALAIVFVMVRTFEQLADAFVLAIWPFYAGGAAAVYTLRRKRPELTRAYRTWGYPVTPLLFILAVILLIGNALVEDLTHGLRDNFSYYRALFTGSALPYESSGALLVLAIVLAGIPAYFIWNATTHIRSQVRTATPARVIMPAMVQTAPARTKVISRKQRRSGWRKWAKRIITALLIVAVLYQVWTVFWIFRFRSSNPSSTALMEQRASEARARGEEVKRAQTWVPYDRISRNLTRAVLAGEDSRFFDHAGFDWEEMRKALEEDWNRGEFRRGASTITQQLAKNLFLSTSKNPLRKLHEAIITKEMEWILGKRRILEIYLNVIEWGDGVYGAEAAARTYFNTSAAALNSDQAAFLSAIIPSPNGAFNPATHRRRVERRKNLIERLMRHVVVPRDLD